jgi:hypothetical protein
LCSIELEFAAQVLCADCLTATIGGKSLLCTGVLVRIRRLVVRRSAGKRPQHWVVAPTLDDHQGSLSLLLGELVNQLVQSLLRGHPAMVARGYGSDES